MGLGPPDMLTPGGILGGGPWPGPPETLTPRPDNLDCTLLDEGEDDDETDNPSLLSLSRSLLGLSSTVLLT